LGTVSSSSYSARICRDSTCTKYGNISFLPSGGVSTVTLSTTTEVVTGYAWGEDLGWINFAPTGSGVLYASSTGELSGYAWSSLSGWINMRPSNSGTISLGIPVGVTVLGDGSWHGWAFASGAFGGWIKFDCSVTTTCVRTIWNATSSTSTPPVIPPALPFAPIALASSSFEVKPEPPKEVVLPQEIPKEEVVTNNEGSSKKQNASLSGSLNPSKEDLLSLKKPQEVAPTPEATRSESGEVKKTKLSFNPNVYTFDTSTSTAVVKPFKVLYNFVVFIYIKVMLSLFYLVNGLF
jgi:hypothetical protein